MKKLLALFSLIPALLFGAPQAITKDGGALTASFTVPSGVSITATGTGTIAATTVTGFSPASGKVLTLSNTLTFTGTDSSSVDFGAGGTVLYSGGSGFVSSITGTAGQITASASTGAVTLSLPSAITGIESVTLGSYAAGAPVTGQVNVNASAADTGYVAVTYGNANYLRGYAAGGTFASPAATASGATLISINGGGYANSAFTGTKAQIAFITSETWTASANGTRINFYSTVNGSTTQQDYVSISQGTLSIGRNNKSIAAWSVGSGGLFDVNQSTVTDTTSTGTVASVAMSVFRTPTLAASSATTYTTGANVYIVGDLAAGTNVTLSNSYGLWNGGKTRLDGRVGIGADQNANILLTLGDVALSSGTGVFGAYGALTVPSGATGTSTLFFGNPRTAAASFTAAVVSQFRASTAVVGSGSTITVLEGFTVTNGMTQGGTNYGFRGSLAASALTRWNTFMDGTAPNHFAGEVYVGAATDAGAYALQVTGDTNLTGSMVASGSITATGTGFFGTVGAGTNPSGITRLRVGGNLPLAAWGSNGPVMQVTATTNTDTTTAASGTVAAAVFSSFAQPTLAATNASVTTTDAATVYVANAPAAGTNQTITNPWALWVDAGAVRFDGDVYLPGGATLVRTQTALTDGAGAGTATFTNAPVSSNPTKWIGINDNGTTRYIPAF